MSEVRRKKIRLPGSVYETGWYFVTICTKDRREILSVIRPTVGADDSVRPCGVSPGFEMSLTPLGGMVQKCLEHLRNEEVGVLIDKYVIMPNHLHVIICLEKGEGGQSRPPLQRDIGDGVPGISRPRNCFLRRNKFARFGQKTPPECVEKAHSGGSLFPGAMVQ